jgi:hypothetical protein
VLAVHPQIVHWPLLRVLSVYHRMIVPPATAADGPVFPQNIPRVGISTPS